MMNAFPTSRRGWPKQSVAANDNAKDLGTPESQMKRAAAAQGLDPAATSHPLDLLLARGLVDAQAHRAGWRYAGLYRQIIGRTEVSYGRLYDGLRGEDARPASNTGNDEDLAYVQRCFRQAQAALRAEGPVVAGITERLVVFGTWPEWLFQPVTVAHRDLDLLRRGLARLVTAGRASSAANDNAAPQVMA
jgi:hypothetical protein